MGKFFPKLSQTHVFIETDTAGNGFSCPMLPVFLQTKPLSVTQPWAFWRFYSVFR